MKFSYNWIHEFVEGLDVPARELERLITMKTAECEGIEETGALLEGASIARILSVKPIEGGHNRKVVAETDRYGKKTVVCGAPNVRVGMTTAYVPLGMKTIDGVTSDGMLASAAELGINRDHSGIAELDSLDRLHPDHVIEVDNKSLTHRPDLWGHYGMAREVAAIVHKSLRDPVDLRLIPNGAARIKVEIEDLALCPRYSALVFANVTVQPSPLWLQYRLEAIGLNPINNIVDVTNYIMSELAQPMHAFDRDRLHGDTIFARPAKTGERIVALNEEEYELKPSNLVIADAAGPIAIAGIIGGRDSAIGDGTTRIVLESANFQAASVRKTSVALKLRTDASMRFEKSQDPVNTEKALARAIVLLKEVSPGIRLVGGMADVKRELPPAPVIELSVDWLRRKLGRGIEAGEVQAILESLGFGVASCGTRLLSVTVPSWRATKDISIADDLVEEVGRMIGYDSIAPQAPKIEAAVAPVDRQRIYHRDLREKIADFGFTEVYNYSFVSEEIAAPFGFALPDHIKVLNPIASDQAMLRTSLLPGIRKNIIDNSRYFQSFRLFEIGREYHKRVDGLPEEIPHLVAAIYTRGDGTDGLFELKGVAEALLENCGTKPTEARVFEHLHRAAEILMNGHVAGRLFELHPSLMAEGRAAVLDLDLAVTLQHQRPTAKYTPLRRFPASSFDLSVITGHREYAGEVSKQLAALAGDLLIGIEYLRQFDLGENRKSLSYRLTFSAPDRTLSSGEVNEARGALIERMRSRGYELRV